MKFSCDSCKTQKERLARCVITVDNEYKRFCVDCVSPQSGIPDVFWDGKPEENLADDPVTGKPRVFFSKGQKAEYLKARGLAEAGDRVHGAPVQLGRDQMAPKVDTRHEVRMALKKVKEMGADRRRQEFLRIRREGARRYA